jgi:hypothetical protein
MTKKKTTLPRKSGLDTAALRRRFELIEDRLNAMEDLLRDLVDAKRQRPRTGRRS